MQASYNPIPNYQYPYVRGKQNKMRCKDSMAIPETLKRYPFYTAGGHRGQSLKAERKHMDGHRRTRSWCSGLDAYVLPKFLCWNPNPQCDSIWRVRPLEGDEVRRAEPFWMRLVFSKRFSRETSHAFCHVRTQEDSHPQARKQAHRVPWLWISQPPEQ